LRTLSRNVIQCRYANSTACFRNSTVTIRFPGSNRATDCSIEKFGACKYLYFQYFALPPFFPSSFSRSCSYQIRTRILDAWRVVQPKFFHVRTMLLRKKIPRGRRHIQWINYARESCRQNFIPVIRQFWRRDLTYGEISRR